MDWLREKFLSLFFGKYQGVAVRALTQFLMGALGAYGLKEESAAAIATAFTMFAISLARGLWLKFRSVQIPENPPAGTKPIEVIFAPKDQAPKKPYVTALPPARQP